MNHPKLDKTRMKWKTICGRRSRAKLFRVRVLWSLSSSEGKETISPFNPPPHTLGSQDQGLLPLEFFVFSLCLNSKSCLFPFPLENKNIPDLISVVDNHLTCNFLGIKKKRFPYFQFYVCVCTQTREQKQDVILLLQHTSFLEDKAESKKKKF